MKICNFDLIILFIMMFIVVFIYDQIKSFLGFKETFQTTTSGYQADVEAIRNLSSIATQLTKDNQITIPGALNVTNKLSANNTISVSHSTPEGGQISIINPTKSNKDGKIFDKWSIYNFGGINGNKLTFYKYGTNENGTNKMGGNLLELTDAGDVLMSGNVGIRKNTEDNKDGHLSVAGSINTELWSVVKGDSIIGGQNAWILNANNIGNKFLVAPRDNNTGINDFTKAFEINRNGDVKINGNLNVDRFDLRRLYSMFTCAGYAVDSDGSTILLFEGTTSLNITERHRWNYAYIFRGWVVLFTGRNNLSVQTTNTSSNIPVQSLALNDNVDNYTATWIGF